MKREQLIALLGDAKANNGGSPDFLIIVPENESRSVLMTLKYLEAAGDIDSYDRRDAPDGHYFDITGYDG